MQLRFQTYHPKSSLPLTDQHVGDFGDHRLIRSADVNDAAATLLVRRGPYGEADVIPRERWRFAREVDGRPVEDDGHIWVAGGFEAGLIYDVLYTPLECPVVGAGLLATRDLASYLRYEESSPAAGSITHVIAEGQSQCGRFLRTFLHLGLNNDEAGRPVFDGVLAHIAGGRRCRLVTSRVPHIPPPKAVMVNPATRARTIKGIRFHRLTLAIAHLQLELEAVGTREILDKCHRRLTAGA